MKKQSNPDKNVRIVKRYNVMFKKNIVKALQAIAAINKTTTGQEEHCKYYYDDNGNRRRKFVPYALFMEKGSTGCAQIFQVCEDGNNQIPLHKGELKYCSVVACLEAIKSYKVPSTNENAA